MDSDEMAETRILAKKMLRKKQRSELLDATYNRYSFHENPTELPSWFVEDEGKHYYRRYNATKEEIAAEKEEIKVYNARPSKKVEEAKSRKKKRLVKAMQKIKTKA
jgi:AdoMet-dependent rRNA methyltransferase SPB1